MRFNLLIDLTKLMGNLPLIDKYSNLNRKLELICYLPGSRETSPTRTTRRPSSSNENSEKKFKIYFCHDEDSTANRLEVNFKFVVFEGKCW